jgi:cell division protein FtsW
VAARNPLAAREDVAMKRAARRGELESRILILVTLALVAFGIVMVYSATSAAAAVGGTNPNYYLERQVTYAALGIVLLVIAQRWDYRRLRALAPGLVVVSLFLLVAVLAIGPAVNGARRWIAVGPAVFQPSELAKLALAIWAASYLSRRPAPRTLKELARPFGLLAVLFAGLVILEPDLGTAIAIVLMLFAMLLVAGTRLSVLGAALAIAGAAGVLAIWLEPYRRARFFAFLHPWDDAQASGFQIVQAMIGMGSGGIFGVGLGQGVQKIFYLPEAPTDMMLANIGEELGLIGVFAVVMAYVLFAYAGLRIALGCRDPFGKRLAAGLTVLVCGQAAVNASAVVGIAPLTGIPLPFLSYGGSSLVVLLASVGILLNIAQRGNAETASMRDRGRRDGRTRSAGTRSRGRADDARRVRDVRRVAGSRRSAARS